MRTLAGDDLIARFRWLRPVLGATISLGDLRSLHNGMPLRAYRQEGVLLGGSDLRYVDLEGAEIWRTDGGTGQELLVQALDQQNEVVAFGAVVLQGTKAAAVVGLARVGTGEMVWRRELTSDAGYVSARGVTFMPGGDVILVGRFSGQIQLPGTALMSRGATDGFAIRLGAKDGTPVWAVSLGGPIGDSADLSSTSVDGTTWFAGRLTGSAEIGGVTLHSSRGSMDGYVAQVSPDGEIRVVTRLYGPHQSEGVSSLVHTSAGTYVVGYFSSDMWIGGFHLKPTSRYGRNGFIAFADHAGKVQWAKTTSWIGSAGAAAADASEGGLWILSNGDADASVELPIEMQLSHLSPTGERSFSVDVGKGTPRSIAQVGSKLVFGWVSHPPGRRVFNVSFATLE